MNGLWTTGTYREHFLFVAKNRRWLKRRGFNPDPSSYDTCGWFMYGKPAHGLLFAVTLYEAKDA